MALLHLVYRDALFPRPAYYAVWERLLEARGARIAFCTTVDLLALADERGCEAELAAVLTTQLDGGGVPDLACLRAPLRPDRDLTAHRRGQPAVDRQLRQAAARYGRDSITVDTARLPLLLGELRMPTIAKLWQTFTERADREAWPSARLLATLAELEFAERAQRRVQQHLLEARLRPGKTLGSSDVAGVPPACPWVSHAHVTALANGDAWLNRGINILLFGASGSGKSHFAAVLGHALVKNGYGVLFTRTTELAQRLKTGRQSVSLDSAIDKLDKYHLIIIDDSR